MSAYKYTGVITGEKIQEVMQSSGAMSSMTGLDLADGEELAVHVCLQAAAQIVLLHVLRGDGLDHPRLTLTLMQAYESEGIGEPVGISRMVLTMTCANPGCAGGS